MKNINTTLVYILSFIAITTVSFGVTYGALSVLAKDDNPEPVEIVETTEPEAEEDTTEDTAEVERPRIDGWNTELITINDNTSIDIQLPEGWTVEDSSNPDAINTPTKLIRSPEVISADQSPTGIHFCLAFANYTEPNPTIQSILDAPVSINSTASVFNMSASAQVKTPQQNPDRPFLFVSTNPDGSQVSEPFPLPDQTQLMITGGYGCEDNVEASSTYPTAEEFNSQPEVTTALDILAYAALITQETPDPTQQLPGSDDGIVQDTPSTAPLPNEP